MNASRIASSLTLCCLAVATLWATGCAGETDEHASNASGGGTSGQSSGNGGTGIDETGGGGGGGGGGTGGTTLPGDDADTGEDAKPSGGSGGGPRNDGGGSTTSPTTATFRTLLTLQYLTVQGGAVTADADTQSEAESFTVTDLNGGSLEDGDEVHLASESGTYLSAVQGGGSALVADAASAGDDETFVVVRLDGPSPVSSGDRIALRAKAKDTYVSSLDGGGGDVRVDAPWARSWENFRVYLGGDGPPSALAAKQLVLDFVGSVSGKEVISGQHNKYNTAPRASTDWIHDHTGKYPALWSADFSFGHDQVEHRSTMIREAKAQWGQGAIVQIMYHNCSPTRDEYCTWWDIGGDSSDKLTDAQWSDLITEGTSLNSAWKQRLDTLSVFFESLRMAGVAPVFRPLHEMNQGVFWWGGRPGPQGTRRLWQMTHDYLVNQKGFDHIIWMWNVQDFGSLGNDVWEYDPGAAYYDIASLDIYGEYDAWKYDAIRSAAGTTPFGIGECARVPTAGLLAQQPGWAFFMLWPDFLEDNANAGLLNPIYGAPNVVTLDRMPGWQ